MNISTLKASTIDQELETADKLMNQIDKPGILTALHTCLYILEHESCMGQQKIKSMDDFKSFYSEYEDQLHLGFTKELYDLSVIFALNHVIRKSLMEALAARVAEIYHVGAK